MATSSITKDFYVKDQEALERLQKVLEEAPEHRKRVESPSLKEGKEKLSTFVFHIEKPIIAQISH